MLAKSTLIRAIVVLLLLSVISICATYKFILSGGLTARQVPSALETYLARTVLLFSVPSEEKDRKNPLHGNIGAALAGRELYEQKCTVCHSYDGSGHSEAGEGLYPPPLDLRRTNIVERTDGELAYFIKNGIRNTAMPAWQLPDQQVWQLVSYIRDLPTKAKSDVNLTKATPGGGYVGSAACKQCHSEVYDRWLKTRMANVVRDPKIHLDAIIPDLSKAGELVTFKAEDVALVYGSRWKQRYFKKIGDDYFPFPAQWNVQNKVWSPYFVKDDWWAPHYPPDNFKRPTGPLCDGCHSVNYDVVTKTVTEWNVGCEKCHGQGGEHVRTKSHLSIINPARLDYVQANDVCIQCHSQGRPQTNPIEGKYYDWPVGFEVGKLLNNYWKIEENTLGQSSFTHFADGTAHKNRMQGNDYVTSLMYTHGITCSTCHDSHGTEHAGLLRKPANAICLDCHSPKSPNGPFAASIEDHTHHSVGSPGSECVACHMPKIAQTIANVNVRSHTFRFVSPVISSTLKVPNACTACHTDKSVEWTIDALKSWSNRSPWRTGNIPVKDF